MPRSKKPTVKPEQRREWLRRVEEDGDSATTIAGKMWDIRTVKTQVELARSEREAREARLTVLRDALQQHQKDMLGFVERLNDTIKGVSGSGPSPDDPAFESALRHHLPRSPIWGYLKARENLKEREAEDRKELGKAIGKLVESDTTVRKVSKEGTGRISAGIAEVLSEESIQWLGGNTSFSLKDRMRMEPAGPDSVTWYVGYCSLGPIREDLAKKNESILRNAIDRLEAKVPSSEEYGRVTKTLEDIKKVEAKLKDELTVIRLRRIVPGKCEYCPI